MKRIGIVVLTLFLLCGLAVPSSVEMPAGRAAAAPAPDPAVLEPLKTKGLEQVAESDGLLLLADSQTGAAALYHKAAGTFWYTNPPEYMGEEMVGQERVLSSSQLKITYYDKQFLQGEALSTVGSLNKGGLSCQKTTDGIQFTYHFPQQGFTIPLRYTLKDDYLEVSVPVDEVKEEGDYTLGEVMVLPFFGSGAEKDEGYILVPDGTGALIDFQNDSHSNTAYSQPVYGRDRTLTKVRETYASETVRMPVVGIHREEGGLLCIADQGAGLATVNAQLANLKEKRHMGYFSFQFRPADWITLNSTDRNAREVVAFASRPAETEAFSVRYYPLDGEGSYFDMAQRYRQYLTDEAGLSRSEARSKDLPFYITSYGAVVKRGSVLWIPTDVVVPLTTCTQLTDMISDLQGSGIRGIVADYRAWQSGGYTGKLPTGGKVEGKLGSRKEFAALFEKAQTQDAQVFAGLNLVDLYKPGNGFSKSSSAARTVNGAPALQYDYSLISGFSSDLLAPWYLFSPLQYEKALGRILDKLPERVGGIGMGSIGSELYADFRDGGRDRLGTQEYYVRALQKAAERGPVMADSVNAFLLPYVDYIAGAPVENSRFDIESSRVPFYQLVLHGYKSYSVPAVNLSADANRMLLYAAETGASLQYVFHYQNFDEVSGTYLQDVYNSNYRDWQSDAAEYYTQLNGLYQRVKDSAIVNHRQPAQDVARVDYDNGTVVIVNYGQTAYASDWGTVEPESFGVFAGKGEAA